MVMVLGQGPSTIALLLSFALLGAEATQGQQGESVGVESIKDSELPKMVEVTEAVKVRLVGESGRAGMVGLPKGARVEVTGRDGNMLGIVFGKSAGKIDISKTTALAEVSKIRTSNEQAQQALDEELRAQAERARQARETEERLKRDILVHSWQWRESASGDFFEAVGEIENESGRVLENVQVEITIRDTNDKIVSTDTAIVSDRDLRPGQQTTFRAMIRRVGGEQKASLAFRKFWGERYTHREK
jgi:hypothetical protein